jgi:hypothetical protein
MNFAGAIPLKDAERIAARKALTKLPIFTALELGKMEFPPIEFVVPGYLPTGCTIFAGRPKLGKSWLALEMAIAVAEGGTCLGGVECPRGDVLYLALEDNKRRLQNRIHKLCPARGLDPWPTRLSLATEWHRGEAGIGNIRTWALAADNPRLVIVDVLAMFREARAGEQSLYEGDYAAVKALQSLASELDIAVLIVHHVRKGAGDGDPFERVSGTLGLTGAADTAIVLDRDSGGCTLYARGRDVEEYERAVLFDKLTCKWAVQGEASEVRRTDERSVILGVLRDADEPMSPADVADATGTPRNNTKQLLFKMARAGEVLKAKRGRYVHSNRTDLLTPDNFDNRDNQSTLDGGEEDNRG